MKQSNNNKKSRDVTAFLYERLSRDDNMDGESYSIGNQKKLLTKVAKEKGYTNLVHFFDDGISGVTMDRPGFADMIQQLEQGKAAAVFVKDLSRLGRNYIEVGRLTEEFFPNHDIRLVAVSDNIDTDEGENELAPIRNLFNEWYARDISKKRRISNKIKGNAGEPMGQPPYQRLVPNAGTFGYTLYQISPLLMAVVYSFFNSLALALFAVFALAIQMIVKFNNQYVAIVIPVILLYAITFAFDSVPLLLPYDIRIIIQPRSANAITEIVTKQDFEITFCAWIVADSFLTLIGLARNKDIL